MVFSSTVKLITKICDFRALDRKTKIADRKTWFFGIWIKNFGFSQFFFWKFEFHIEKLGLLIEIPGFSIEKLGFLIEELDFSMEILSFSKLCGKWLP